MALSLSLSKMPWYGQVGAFAFLSIAGAGVFWNFYAKPANSKKNPATEDEPIVEADLFYLSLELEDGVDVTCAAATAE